jgi:hypothetical protein
MRDDEIDIDRVRERVKQRLQRRNSPLRWILWIVILVLIGNLFVRPWPTNMPFIPGNTAAWAIFAVLVYLAWRSKFRSRSSSRRAMPSEDDIARAVRKELRRERRRLVRNRLFDSAAHWSEEDYDYDEGDEDLYEKPKRTLDQPMEKRKADPGVQLGDDGELIFDDEEQVSRRGQM